MSPNGLMRAVAALVLASPLTLDAQDPRDAVIVSVDWLAQHYQDPNLVLIQVGPEEDFAKEHLPGARYLSHRHDMGGGLILELPAPDDLQRRLRDLGVSNDSRVVVYRSSEWISPSTRVLFELYWAGADAVFLDGGLDAWKAAGHPVTADTAAPRAGNFTIRPKADLVVTADWVQQHATAGHGYQLLDGRARAFYDGVREDRGKAGHIAGAGSMPWVDLFDENGRLKDAATLRALLTAAGVEEGETVVAYCHIGQYATAVLLAARTLGHEVRLYDGAMQDWAQRDLPVVAAGN